MSHCLQFNLRLLGINRYMKDIEIMLGRPPFLWWKICWMAVSPIIICVSSYDPNKKKIESCF